MGDVGLLLILRLYPRLCKVSDTFFTAKVKINAPDVMSVSRQIFRFHITATYAVKVLAEDCYFVLPGIINLFQHGGD